MSLDTVVLDMYSGLPNPQWTLAADVAGDLLRELSTLPPASARGARLVLAPRGRPADPLGRPRSGYRGFLICRSGSPEAPAFEVYGRLVLDSGTRQILTDKAAAIPIEQRIFATAPENIRKDLDGMTLDELTTPGREARIAKLEGPHVDLACDGAPRYLGGRDAFNRHARRNNCYNYATGVLNTTRLIWAIPGRDNARRQFPIDTLRAALEADRLEFRGMRIPSRCPPEGAHYVAALIRRHPTGRLRDFHFLRLDQTGRWSHKDGNGQVDNEDDAGNRLRDLTQANLSWSPELVGFYLVLARHRGLID